MLGDIGCIPFVSEQNCRVVLALDLMGTKVNTVLWGISLRRTVVKYFSNVQSLSGFPSSIVIQVGSTWANTTKQISRFLCL
jgi:hypothetical protein